MRFEEFCPPITSSTSFPFQPAWVYGALRWAMCVRGSVAEPPAPPKAKGPQPASTFSKSSAKWWPPSGVRAERTTRTSSRWTVPVPDPAAADSLRVAVDCPAGTSKSTFMRCILVPFFSLPPRLSVSGEESAYTVAGLPPAGVTVRVAARPVGVETQTEAAWVPGARPVSCWETAGVVPGAKVSSFWPWALRVTAAPLPVTVQASRSPA